MRASEFDERAAEYYDLRIGGKRIFVAGHTAMRQVVVFGNVVRLGDQPLLCAVHAPITPKTGADEQLRITLFDTDPGKGEVVWGFRHSGRVLLNSVVDSSRLIVPMEGMGGRVIVDGALLAPVPDMIDGPQPPHSLPPTLEAMAILLTPPPAELRAVA